jgi:uncharacterized protein (DUF1778 family)
MFVAYFEPMSYDTNMAKQTRSPMTTDRERQVGVRLSEEELKLISDAADKLGLRASQYARLAALERARADLQALTKS